MPLAAFSQVDVKIITPKPDSLIPGDNLFISIEVDSKHEFASTAAIEFYLDGYLLTGITKINKNKARFVYPYKLRDGKHSIRLEAGFIGADRPEHGEWVFYSGKKNGRGIGNSGNYLPEKDKVKLNGTLSIEDREESISGSKGDSLRQEPRYTRSLNLDAVAIYKNIEMPVKIFATSNNLPGFQNMNFYQVGFKNKWLELTGGDQNPSFDQLVLSGVRVRGIGVKFKSHLSSVQFIYGDMTNPVQGSLQTYQPGQGVLPVNLSDSTHYIVPGTYKRTMMALRVELGSPRDEIKLCATVFKAKDDVNSIKYGLLPKDNVAAGIDFTVKALHKKLIIRAGAAMSILTNDITSGAITPKELDSFYHVTGLRFEPPKLKDIIIMNASTLPANISPDFNNMSSFINLTYSTKIQTFSVSAKNIGPVYYSLGNPYLLNDYQGVNASERVSFFKRKISIGGGYQNYTNNLAFSSYVSVNTQGYNGSLSVFPGVKWPSLLLTYMHLNRSGKSEVNNYPGIEDELVSYMANLNYGVEFLKLKHNFRLMMNASKRNDKINYQNQYTSVSGMFGVNESINSNLSVNADIGKTIINGYGQSKISDVLMYNVAIDWKIKPENYFTTLAVANNQTMLTPFSNPSYRFSFLARFGYRFYKGMGIDLEAGYQPFYDRLNNSNSYSELYSYVRYTCDLGKLF